MHDIISRRLSSENSLDAFLNKGISVAKKKNMHGKNQTQKGRGSKMNQYQRDDRKLVGYINLLIIVSHPID